MTVFQTVPRQWAANDYLITKVVENEDTRLPQLAWCVWYADGSCYRSADYSVDQLQESGVQAVVCYFLKDGEVRRFIHCGYIDAIYIVEGQKLIGTWLGTEDDPTEYEALKRRIHADSWRPAIS